MKTTRITVFERPNLHIVYLPELESMMMEHLGSASEQEYKEAYMALPKLWRQYPWKALVSHEVHLKNIPTSVRLWLATKYSRYPEVQALMQKNWEQVNIISKDVFAASLANVLHATVQRVLGIKQSDISDEAAAFTYLKRRYSPLVKVA